MPAIVSHLPASPSTTTLTHINPQGLYDPAPNGYTHVVVAPAQGRVVYASGQGGENAAGELPPGFAQQLDQALDNMRIALQAAGARTSDVARLTLLVVDHTEARVALWTAAAARMWPGGPTPACTLIPVPRLALDGMLVEIEATAVVL
ncbi:RidA family protein [Acidovorax sp.]|uniref:RidA family protein n=1 Tax=Acidovorax sp. TaxID=1872122 RepID=UPI00391C03E4